MAKLSEVHERRTDIESTKREHDALIREVHRIENTGGVRPWDVMAAKSRAAEVGARLRLLEAEERTDREATEQTERERAAGPALVEMITQLDRAADSLRATAEAAQGALVTLLDAAASYRATVAGASAELAQRGLQPAGSAACIGERVWSAPDGGLVAGWVLHRVLAARLPHGHGVTARVARLAGTERLGWLAPAPVPEIERPATLRIERPEGGAIVANPKDAQRSADDRAKLEAMYNRRPGMTSDGLPLADEDVERRQAAFVAGANLGRSAN